MLDAAYLRSWLLAFLVTQAVEMPIYLAVLGRPRRYLTAFGASAITHPIIWFVIAPAWVGAYWPMVALAEAFAVVTEAVFLWRMGMRRAWLWSLVANGASFSVGLLLARLHWLG